MRVSSETQSVLKNFATINQSILVEPGNLLWSVARSGVVGKASVAESFPVTFGVYDLNNFLAVLGMFRTPECDFQDNFVRISEADGGSYVKYLYAAPSCVGPQRPRKMAVLPPQTIEFVLQEDKWTGLQTATNVLRKPEFRIVSDGCTVSMTTHDSKYPGGHEFSTIVDGDANGVTCNTILSLSNLKLIQGSYKGTVTPTYAVFTNTSGYDLTYWIACHPDSTFGN